jgi:hypothetical protein
MRRYQWPGCLRLARALPCGCAGSPGSIGRCDSNSISRVRRPTGGCHFSNALVHSHAHRRSSGRRAHHSFAGDLFENVNLHRLVGHQTLEPRVFIFQRSESLRFADFHPTELSLPAMVGGRADIMRTHWLYRVRVSAFRKIPMICSSLDRLLFIFCSFFEQNSSYVTSPFDGSGYAYPGSIACSD